MGMVGPLTGTRVIEMGGIGPAPFACMLLADHGAEVIRVERPGASNDSNVLHRSRKMLHLDLKQADAVDRLHALIDTAEVLVEGFRPGTMERLGLGPDELLATNPKLVYGRMTGWGQTGPYSALAGHDINYISLSGALHAIGRAGDRPIAPPALIGDFGGGGMFFAFSLLSGLLRARSTGEGQVIDCAMTEGSALLMATFFGKHSQGTWRDERGVNLVDSGAPFYDAYETSDGLYISVGAIEPQFYRLLCEVTGLAMDPDFATQMDEKAWPRMKEKAVALFRTKTREEWCALFARTDACFASVLSIGEAPGHPHNVSRGSFVNVSGVVQPAPAPKYSRTPLATPRPPIAFEELQ